MGDRASRCQTALLKDRFAERPLTTIVRLPTCRDNTSDRTSTNH